MAYAIHVFPHAMVDIRRAVTWNAERSTLAGTRLHKGLLNAVRTLADDPKRCPLAAEASDLGIELRELLYRRRRTVYRILFTIEGESVNVLRVRHAARDQLTSDDI